MAEKSVPETGIVPGTRAPTAPVRLQGRLYARLSPLETPSKP